MTRRLPLSQWKEPKTCDCETCRSMCKVPCIPSPEEAQKLIDLGYGSEMMINIRYLKEEVLTLSPARQRAKGKTNWDGRRGCVLQKRGKCSIHTVCKPIEGRLAICRGREPVDLRDRVVKLWDNEAAQQLVKQWANAFGKEDIKEEFGK